MLVRVSHFFRGDIVEKTEKTAFEKLSTLAMRPKGS